MPAAGGARSADIVRENAAEVTRLIVWPPQATHRPPDRSLGPTIGFKHARETAQTQLLHSYFCGILAHMSAERAPPAAGKRSPESPPTPLPPPQPKTSSRSGMRAPSGCSSSSGSPAAAGAAAAGASAGEGAAAGAALPPCRRGGRSSTPSSDPLEVIIGGSILRLHDRRRQRAWASCTWGRRPLQPCGSCCCE